MTSNIPVKAVLFDLDGTIIDSEEGITKCVQYALHAFGIDEPDLNNLKCFIGPPLEPSFTGYYGMTHEEALAAVDKYRERYDVKGAYECSLYDGVKDAIKRLSEKGYFIALASSKPEMACRKIIEHFGLTEYFDEIVGSTLDGTISTKEEVLKELMRRVPNIDRSEMCLIGDTTYDAIGAKKCGIRSICITYGFGKRDDLIAAGADVVFDTIEGVEEYIENECHI